MAFVLPNSVWKDGLEVQFEVVPPCYKLVYSYSNYCIVVMAINPLQKQPVRFFCCTSLKNPLAQNLVFVAQNLVFVPPPSRVCSPNYL